MKWFLLLAIVCCGANGASNASDGGKMFTIFLARHAEKESIAEDLDDPPLSTCGERRAESLAAMLKDVTLEHVYSTPFIRSRNTALPSAQSHGLEIEDYDPAALEEFSGLLRDNKQNALVIGHSNTTAVLAGLLAGEAGEEFSEEEYDRIYLVTVSAGGRQMTLLHQLFDCDRH